MLNSAFGGRARSAAPATRTPSLGGTGALLVVASAALLLGLGVYLVDRPASHARWIPAIGSAVAGHRLGAAGDWLPSFVHALAFSLLTAAVLRGTAVWTYAGCMTWALVDLAFEAAQHAQLREPLIAALRATAVPRGVVDPLADYLLRGTFDVADVVAVLAGSASAAAALLLFTREPRSRGDPT